MILRTDREWLDTVKALPESDLPCNASTVAYAVAVAVRAMEAHDAIGRAMDRLVASLCDEDAEKMGLTA